jgi:dihydroxyacetone kinase-like predicted kinase
VVPAANRAAEESSKDVRVIEARSVPAGLAAATAFNATLSAEENTNEMAPPASSTGAGELARAERDAETPAGHVSEGDWIGLARGEAVSVGASATDTAVRVARALVSDGSEVITVVAGAGTPTEERTEIERALRASFPGLAVEVIDGGQPRYPFLIGVE